MNLNFKSLPIGNLPYEDIRSCKNMMLRLFENIPFLAELPGMDVNDNIYARSFTNIQGISQKDNKFLLFDSNSTQFIKTLSSMDKSYNDADNLDLEMYSSDSPFFSLYLEILKRIQPEYTVIRLLGPFTFANSFFNHNPADLLNDKMYRKYITQAVGLKTLWFIKKIKEVSPKTTPLILYEEEKLYKFGNLKRINESITNESIISLYTKLFTKIKKTNSLIGVQSFEKCNWQLLLDSNIDLISFNAYNYPNSLNIIAPKINNFLARGGYINWGIIPVNTEETVRTLNIEILLKKFNTVVEDLANAGVSLDLILSHATVSQQGNLANMPTLFAEKVLMLQNQLAKRIPASSRQ